SHAVISSRLGVGANSFSYSDPSYIQIGEPNVPSSSSTLYISAGANSQGRVNFYRGSSKIGAIGTNGNNIQIFSGGSDISKLYIDSTNFKIYNSTLIVSPTQNDSAPALYVDGNSRVGVGTNAPTHPLTVSGNIKITGSGNGIIFNDGTILNSSSSISIGAISNNSDALIQADADNNGTGKIILRVKNNDSLIVDNTGKIGIGTANPSDKFQIIGGDVVIGNTINPYSGDSKEDLVVAGNIVVDGTLKQRTATPVEFTSLYVSQDVYLSTATGYKTGIGTLTPNYTLDVNGDINTSGNLRLGGTNIITSGRLLQNLTGISSSGNINFSSLTSSRLVATDGSNNLTSSITSADLRSSITDETGTGAAVFNTAPSFNTSISVSGWGNFTQGITASSGTFTASGATQYSIESSSGIFVTTGTINLNNSARVKNSLDPVDNQDLTTKKYVDSLLGGGGIEPTAWIITGNSAGSNRVLGTTNSQSFNIISNNTPRITIGDTGLITFLSGVGHTIFTNGITASSGTFTTALKVNSFTTAGFVKNDASGVLSGGNSIVATDIPTSNLVNGTGISMSGTLTNRIVGSGNNVTINVSASVPTSVTNDTNVTGSIASNVLTLGWNGQLSLARGGTGSDLSGASNLPVKKSGTSLTTAAIDLSGSEVTNTLPVGKGGTGSTTYTSSQFLWYNGTNIVASGYSNSSFANASHTHNANDINAGTLPIARGGTGSTAYTNNQPVIYNGTALISYAGFNGSFTVANSTSPTGGCTQLNYQYGILASTQAVTCP
ncbi:MAG: beta strand repeat-containing protein, partial [Elusimicrobiales bacterium]